MTLTLFLDPPESVCPALGIHVQGWDDGGYDGPRTRPVDQPGMLPGRATKEPAMKIHPFYGAGWSWPWIWNDPRSKFLIIYFHMGRGLSITIRKPWPFYHE